MIARNLKELGTPNHLLVNRIMDYKREEFVRYCALVYVAAFDRGYKFQPESLMKYLGDSMYAATFAADIMWNVYGLTEHPYFPNWHNEQYLIQCYYNLQEKHNCGGITDKEWQKIVEVMKNEKRR